MKTAQDGNGKRTLFSDAVIDFFRTLPLPENVPADTEVLNPYASAAVQETVGRFYRKYFADTNRRVFILGINPGRFGAGVTGISFTDSDALRLCDIPNEIPETREVSAQFVYRVITEYGGPEAFYKDFFLTSVCPLGFIKNGKNFNYYDSRPLREAVAPYMRRTFDRQRQFGCASTAIVLGKGKNFAALQKMNAECGWFKELIPLEHPRFMSILQHSGKDVAECAMDMYLSTLKRVLAER